MPTSRVQLPDGLDRREANPMSDPARIVRFALGSRKLARHVGHLPLPVDLKVPISALIFGNFIFLMRK